MIIDAMDCDYQCDPSVVIVVTVLFSDLTEVHMTGVACEAGTAHSPGTPGFTSFGFTVEVHVDISFV